MAIKKKRSLERMNLSSLKFLMDEGKLDLSPAYQRDSVWSLYQKQLLIDSILHDIDIPKLYFRVLTKGKADYEVVDGQQRLRAVFEFLDNEFPLSEDSEPAENEALAKRSFRELSTKMQLWLQNRPLDVVHLDNYSDEDVEEMFLRLQNGTALNAAEKRRALQSGMRDVVRELAENGVFEMCSFSNKRFGHEDAAAKLLHLTLADQITDIKPDSLKRTYLAYRAIAPSHPSVKRVARSLNFLQKAFKGAASPKFKKYAILSMGYLVDELLEEYDVARYPKEFAKAYSDFEVRRINNKDLPEEERDQTLTSFTEASRNDSVESMTYRHTVLKRELLAALPSLERLDDQRHFSEEQKFVIFRRDQGNCQSCGTACDPKEWHADHKKPFSKGGKTAVENGRVLCIPCNTRLGNKND